MSDYYYLHSESKDLIYKPEICVQSDPEYFNSPFVQKVWRIDITDRADAWMIVLESLALGARIERVKELAQKWGCDYNDSFEMLARNPKPAQQLKDGMKIFIEKILKMDAGDYWDKVRDKANAEAAA
jgi:hypothetical protein